MRLDRLITLGLIQPFRRATRTDRSNPCNLFNLFNSFNPSTSATSLPVLMYHSISDDPEPGVRAYYKTNTSPAVFRQHMQFLHSQGYKTLTLTDAVKLLNRTLTWSGDHPLPSDGRGIKGEGHPVSSSPRRAATSDFRPPNFICLTFDDGFRDFYTEAFPVLHEFGFTATMFLPTGFISESSSFSSSSSISSEVSGQRSEVRDQKSAVSSHKSGSRLPAPRSPLAFAGKEFLTWDQVRELHQAGIEFGSHTVNHPKLVDLDWPQIEFELRASSFELRERLGVPVRSFCYPYAFPQSDHLFANTFRSMLIASGYSSCATTEIGRVRPGIDPFRLKRLPVNSCDDLALFRAKLEGAYDWLARPQAVVKRLKRFASVINSRNKIPAHMQRSTPAPYPLLGERAG